MVGGAIWWAWWIWNYDEGKWRSSPRISGEPRGCKVLKGVLQRIFRALQTSARRQVHTPTGQAHQIRYVPVPHGQLHTQQTHTTAWCAGASTSFLSNPVLCLSIRPLSFSDSILFCARAADDGTDQTLASKHWDDSQSRNMPEGNRSSVVVAGLAGRCSYLLLWLAQLEIASCATAAGWGTHRLSLAPSPSAGTVRRSPSCCGGGAPPSCHWRFDGRVGWRVQTCACSIWQPLVSKMTADKRPGTFKNGMKKEIMQLGKKYGDPASQKYIASFFGFVVVTHSRRNGGSPCDGI